MAYQVLARKWRPQRFDDVVGQQAVTRTLRNAIGSGRIAHAFVFAGSRGCGKTTTARILARALNCVTGPTADPCGACDACVEIAQGRDMDVLEIDAASHTGIDNIREVVIAGLSIAPVRDRYKVFIIDEVHQLSTASFNALLKSIEEPPAHVVFMMATTELHKIPDTILSRSQVFEFKTIPTKLIVEQLRRIAAAETIDVPDAALTLIARSAEGSMRDAQSAFDQVMAFAGQTVTVDDVSTVLGLVGRDLLFDLIEAVVDEDGPRAFALADRAVESGHDLKLVCRELSRVVRDIMIVSVDPGRADGGDLVEGERARLASLAERFSREDLMRAFDVLAKAETDIRAAAHPRYHFEMALLRWMHVRKLVPLADLMEQLGGSRGGADLQGPAVTRTAAVPEAPAGTRRPIRRSTCRTTRRSAATTGNTGSRRWFRRFRLGSQRRAARRDPRRQEDPLRAVHRRGAADRGERRGGDVYVRAESERGAWQSRAEPAVDRSSDSASGRPQDEPRGRPVGGAGSAPARRSRARCPCPCSREVEEWQPRPEGGSDVVIRGAGDARCVPSGDPGHRRDVDGLRSWVSGLT